MNPMARTAGHSCRGPRGIDVGRFDGSGPDVQVGDKITVIALRLLRDGLAFGTTCNDVRHATVSDTAITNGYNERGFEWQPRHTNSRRARERSLQSSGLGWLASEGIHWIRGWHRASSSAIRALLAAQHLFISACMRPGAVYPVDWSESIVSPPAGFFVGQQITIAAKRQNGFYATHANIVALGSTSFKAANKTSQVATEHTYSDEGVTWVRGWIDDTDSLIASRMLSGSAD